MSDRSPYASVARIRKKKQRTLRDDSTEEMEKWRVYWADAGVIRFTEEFLRCPEGVPEHPVLGVIPEHIILSDDERTFLSDITSGKVTRFIVSGARGCGKSFIVAVYVCWRICCFDGFTITVMGGSAEQSEKEKEYVDFWRDMHPEVFFCLPKSQGGGNRTARILSRWRSYARFPSCSDTSARGPHVTQVIVDEAGVGEAKNKGGAKAIKSVRYQLAASKD